MSMPGRKLRTREDTLLASAARTTSGVTPASEVADNYDDLILTVDVTALSGTDSPSLTFTYEVSDDDGTTWFALGSAFTAITTTGKYAFTKSAPIGRLSRFSYAIQGTTPSFTFRCKVTYSRRG